MKNPPERFSRGAGNARAFRSPFVSFLIFTLLTGLLACKDSAEETPPVATAVCRVVSSETIKDRITINNIYKTVRTYTVDAQNRIASEETKTYKQDDSYLDGDKRTYIYDSDGFLTKEVFGYTNFESDRLYSYQNGRLVKVQTAVSNFGGPKEVTSTANYEYDGQGNLSKSIYTATGGTPQTTIYENGKLKSLTTSSYVYEINAQGHVTRVSNGTNNSFAREYTYNAAGLNTGSLSYDEKGNKSQRIEYQYLTTPFKVPTNPMPLKGHPDFPTYYGVDAPVTRKITYRIDANGAESKYSEINYTYQIDPKGNLLSKKEAAQEFGALTNYDTKYAYEGCE